MLYSKLRSSVKYLMLPVVLSCTPLQAAELNVSSPKNIYKMPYGYQKIYVKKATSRLVTHAHKKNNLDSLHHAFQTQLSKYSEAGWEQHEKCLKKLADSIKNFCNKQVVEEKTYPRVFSHVGLSVPDIEKAVEFYSKVFGFYVLVEPTTIEEDDSPIGQICVDVFGEGWGSFKIAHLSTGDGIGIELFQFNNQEAPEDNFEYWKTGIFHICIQDPNMEELIEKVVAAGGKKRMEKPGYFYPGQKPYRMIYLEDPFGNIVELYSHSYDLHYGFGSYNEVDDIEDTTQE